MVSSSKLNMEGLWRTGIVNCSIHVITNKAKLMKYIGRVVRTQEIKGSEREKPEEKTRKKKKKLKLKGKILRCLKIMRNLAGKKHMLGTGGEIGKKWKFIE